jgi:predicted NBD/HSP70 family sugar kinase
MRTLVISDIHGNELAHVTQRRNGSTQSPVESVRALLEVAYSEFAIPRRSITHIVIGVPGTYDPATDTASLVGRLPEWNASGIRASLEGGLKAAVTIENDANLALIAERRLGAASDLGNTALLWIGAGLGLALDFSSGTTPYSGAHGRAGEVGYLPVSLPQDTTGINTDRRPVDLQDLIGGSAIVRLANAYGISGRDPERVVQRAVAVNEKNAQNFLEALGERITIGIAPIAAVVDPDVVVLGGPIGQAGGERLAKETRRHVSRLRAFNPRVIATTVAVDPVLAGSRLLAVDRARDHVLTQVTTDASDAAFVSGLLMRS